MAYHYRLETLLTVRRNFEEQAQQRLAHELFVLKNHKKYLAELEEQRLDLFAVLEERKKHTIAAAMFSFYVEAIHAKNRQIAFQKNAVLAQQEMIETVRADLVTKVKARKVVERLKEKDFLVWQREVLRLEQLESDEQSVMRFGKEVA
ncbi:MAG: flagellar export protein FliJ [Proteobacteria bacterium]|nr:flagellar export protein FliJ [Desulfobulbaceae bacterium]MBU4152922.1 flagellar export protein FliJ [Pseudomonadota bacterium]